MLMISFQGVSAAAQITSGSTQVLGNTLPRGTTAYVVYYSYPSTAQVGTNITIALTLHVNSLSGIVHYVSNCNLEVQVFVGTHELHGSVHSPATAANLYAGSSWGPNNVTIPLTAENTGLAKGESANAIAVCVPSCEGRDYVSYGAPISAYVPEQPMQGLGGSFVIENAVGSTGTSTAGPEWSDVQSILPYALIASGAILMVAAAVLTRRPR